MADENNPEATEVDPEDNPGIVGYINSKFVEPVNPYNKEQPYNNKPDDKALKIKYFIPDSVERRLSLSIEAKI